MIRLAGLVDLTPLKEYYADEPVNHVDNLDGDAEERMDGDMTKAKLLQLSKEVTTLFNTLSSQDMMQDWCQDKIRTAADAISMVYNFVQYENTKVATIGGGDGYPANSSPDHGNNNRAS